MTRKDELTFCIDGIAAQIHSIEQDRQYDIEQQIIPMFTHLDESMVEFDFVCEPTVPRINWRSWMKMVRIKWVKDQKEIFEVAIDWDDDPSIKLSGYSTSRNDEFEKKRDILYGSVAKDVFLKEVEIINEVTSICEQYVDQIKRLEAQRAELQREISDIAASEKKEKEDEVMDRLRNGGINLPKVKKIYGHLGYPSIDRTATDQISCVSHVAIVAESKSGKSVEIECTRTSTHSDEETSLPSEQVKIRSEYLQQLVSKIIQLETKNK